MNLHDAIYKRVSTRTFKKERLQENEIFEIKEILSKFSNEKGPFGNSVHFTFNLNNNVDIDGKKIGTYGFIKNVPAYIGGVTLNSKESIIDFGYLFEKIILELTQKDYSTCWLGGTFKRKDYRKGLLVHEIIPAICPVGRQSVKRSFIDKILRSELQPRNRKNMDELFVQQDGSIIMDKQILSLLEVVRVAPSASNKQPWRAVVDGNIVRFYLERTHNYAKMIKYDIQLLDIGIALSHFEIEMNFQKIKYEMDTSKQKDKENWEYICTYTLSK